MRNLYRLPALLSVGLLLANIYESSAQDWPQWRGPSRDARVVGFTAPAVWPQEFRQQWKVNVGDGVATPALVRGKLFVFARQEGSEVTLCLDAASGKEVWRDQYDALGASGPASRFSGPRSSPAVADGKVVTFGVRGTLSCLDAATGRVLWRKDDFPGAWPSFFTSASPIIVDGACIAQVGGPDNGGIVAYDLATGDQRWKWVSDGPAYASPVLVSDGGADRLVTLTANHVVGINATDGQLVWQANFVPQRRAYNAATPIADGSTIVYTGAGRGTKAVKIQKRGDAFTSQELWSNADTAVQFNTPVLKDGLLFGISDRGEFFCINAENGETAWKKATGERGGYGSIVDAGSVLLALTPEAHLIVLQPTDKEYTEVARVKVAESPVHAYPVLVGNRLYIKDKDSVTLWNIQ